MVKGEGGEINDLRIYFKIVSLFHCPLGGEGVWKAEVNTKYKNNLLDMSHPQKMLHSAKNVNF